MTAGKTPSTPVRGSSRARKNRDGRQLPPLWLTRAGRSAHGLTPTQRIVLMCLWDHADASLVSFPSAPTVASETCLGERAVKAAFVELEARGFTQRATASVKGAHSRKAVTWVLAAAPRATQQNPAASAPPALAETQQNPAASAPPAVEAAPVSSAPGAPRRVKYLTGPGLPDSVRSGAARASDSQGYALANDDEEIQGIEEHLTSTAEPATSRAGNEAAQAEPSLGPRQTSGHVETEPQYARGVPDWPTVKPGEGRPAA